MPCGVVNSPPQANIEDHMSVSATDARYCDAFYLSHIGREIPHVVLMSQSGSLSGPDCQTTRSPEERTDRSIYPPEVPLADRRHELPHNRNWEPKSHVSAQNLSLSNDLTFRYIKTQVKMPYMQFPWCSTSNARKVTLTLSPR